MTESTVWIILVVALGLPGALMGLLFRRLEKKLDQAEAQRTEKENTRKEYELLIIELSLAGLTLSEATAKAIKAVPGIQVNGEMTNALNWSREVKNKYHQFAREQTVTTVNA